MTDLSQLFNIKDDEINFSNEENNIDFYQKSDLKKSKDVYNIAEFIDLVFNVYQTNNTLFNVSTNNVKSFEQKLLEKGRKDYERKIETLDGLALLLHFKKNSGYNINDEQQEEFDTHVNDIKSEAKAKFGDDQSKIEEYVDSYLENEMIEKEIYEDNYNMLNMKEGEEVLEVGDFFGEMPQGTENAGDGYVEDELYLIQQGQ